MLGVQRAAAERGDTVMVGRDIGTVVLPDATLKVYLTARADVRAARRATEMGRPDRYLDYLAEIERRDAADSGRDVAPLRQAAVRSSLDTGELDVDETVEAIVAAAGGDRCVAGSTGPGRRSSASWRACCGAPASKEASTSRARARSSSSATTRSNLDPLILGWAVGNRSGRMIHFMAKAEMLPMAGPRLARDAVGRLLRAARRGGPLRPALRARGSGRRPSDRPLPRGHALARRAPQGRQVRRGLPGHAVGRPAAAGRDRRDAADLPRWLEDVRTRRRIVHSHRRAVHASARSRRPDRPGGPRGRHGTDHGRDRPSCSRSRSALSPRARIYVYTGESP